ncbi:NUDIX domain-containing protein [Parvibaculum sp.]|uniref:NUDIX hydrolase n=1 Tax=Parvibaculum sp. TaxID=2024848 RepID=UPI0032100F7A
MEIRVSAVALLRDDAVLLVRKRGTARFMLPGGKFDAAETPRECAMRELREELGIDIDGDTLLPLGRFSAVAANEPGHVVIADIFTSPLSGTPDAHAEIEELRWFALREPATPDLAPLLAQHVLPRLRERLSPAAQA